MAEVAVDPQTGQVTVRRFTTAHDVGTIINPLGHQGQIEGGLIQGLGFALMEERVVDPTTGTVVNGGLEDYKLLTIADCPEIISELLNEPDPHLSTMGVKGLGEPPIIPTAAAVANAIGADSDSSSGVSSVSVSSPSGPQCTRWPLTRTSSVP